MNDARSTSSSNQSAQASGGNTKGLGRFWVLLALISVLILMGLSAWRQGWFTQHAELFVQLQDGTQGVQIGTPVKLKGFKVGEVDHVDLNPDLSVTVRLRVVHERLSLLGSDAKVKIGRDSPIAPKFFDFMAGDKSKGNLKPSAQVPLYVGGEVEDLMLTAKGVVEKLDGALARINPILDDVKKMSGQVVEGERVAAVLKNVQDISAQVKTLTVTANTLAGGLDKDKTQLLSRVDSILKTLDTTVAQLGKEVPVLTGKLQDVVKEAHGAVANVKAITDEAKTDLPPTLRSTRAITSDIAQITEGAKSTWPISNMVGTEPPTKPLALDAFEAASGNTAGGKK